MLTSQRHAYILDQIAKNGSVSAADLTSELNTSVSTIRRDLTFLEKKGLLARVHGGAVRTSQGIIHTEHDVDERRILNQEEKKRIGKAAAALITPEDFVYIDAGTTTEAMLDFIDQPDALYVTNAISHARALAKKGYKVSLVGGRFKAVTEAIIGEETITSLASYNFTKGFFGTNGIDEKGRLTTPDPEEAATKKAAMKASDSKYILADSSKFAKKSRINFGNTQDATVITCSDSKPFVPEGEEVIFA